MFILKKIMNEFKNKYKKYYNFFLCMIFLEYKII